MNDVRQLVSRHLDGLGLHEVTPRMDLELPVSDAILDTPHRLADARTRQLLIALHLSPRHQAEFGANESADTGESRQENPQQRTDIPKIHVPLLGWLVDRCRFATFLPDQSSHPRGEKPIEARYGGLRWVFSGDIMIDVIQSSALILEGIAIIYLSVAYIKLNRALAEVLQLCGQDPVLHAQGKP